MQNNNRLDDWFDTGNIAKWRRRYHLRPLSVNRFKIKKLKNKLISPQKRLLGRSLLDWALELRTRLHEIYYQKQEITWMENIADIYHQAIIIFLAAGQYKWARDLCYTQIQLFIDWSRQEKNTAVLKNIFIPWLDLIEIDRSEGRAYDAFAKLNILKKEKNVTPIQNKNRVFKTLLYKSLEQDIAMFKAVLFQDVLERVRLLLDTEQYAELIYYLDESFALPMQLLDDFIPEARFVAYANMGDANKALHLLEMNHARYPAAIIPVLKLRECEMRFCINDKHHLLQDIESLYQTIWSELSANKSENKNLDFALHAASLMHSASMAENALKLVYLCYDIASQSGDELWQAECLMNLYQWTRDLHQREKIENLMIAHYFNTQYTVSKQKMLACFPGLKFVEGNASLTHFDRLFEDLLSLRYRAD